jgi:Putative Actinobacterial Holin-X, holin superfamily III
VSAPPAGGQFSAAGGTDPGGHDGPGSPRGEAKGIAAAITEVSERATLLVREEIELAKAEVAEKASRLAKGAVVGLAAGIFFLTALFFVLIGCAWLLYYYLPIGNQFTYFWGFFAMALILVILGLIAGLIAARAVKRGAPPTPDMAIEEARRIRDTVSAGAPDAAGAASRSGAAAGSAAAGTAGAPVSSASSSSSAPAPSYGAAAPHVVDPSAPGGGEGAST